MTTPWVALSPGRFVDRRSRLTRNGFQVYHVGAWRAVVTRKGPDGTREIERCPHAHSSKKAARECGERGARRFNREEAK